MRCLRVASHYVIMLPPSVRDRIWRMRGYHGLCQCQCLCFTAVAHPRLPLSVAAALRLFPKKDRLPSTAAEWPCYISFAGFPQVYFVENYSITNDKQSLWYSRDKIQSMFNERDLSIRMLQQLICTGKNNLWPSMCNYKCIVLTQHQLASRTECRMLCGMSW